MDPLLLGREEGAPVATAATSLHQKRAESTEMAPLNPRNGKHFDGHV